MNNNKKDSKKPEKIVKSLNITNILIVLCAILIIVSLCVIVIPDEFWSKIKVNKEEKQIEKMEQVENIIENEIKEEIKEEIKQETKPEEINKTEVVKSSNSEISEEKAKKVAIKQFKKLGEKGLKTNQLTVQKISRSGEFYYYVVSPNNNLEIKISDGQITRINTVLVNK